MHKPTKSHSLQKSVPSLWAGILWPLRYILGSKHNEFLISSHDIPGLTSGHLLMLFPLLRVCFPSHVCIVSSSLASETQLRESLSWICLQWAWIGLPPPTTFSTLPLAVELFLSAGHSRLRGLCARVQEPACPIPIPAGPLITSVPLSLSFLIWKRRI